MVHFTNWEEKEGEPTMGPIRGRASSEPKILVTSREAACPLAVGPCTPLAGRRVTPPRPSYLSNGVGFLLVRGELSGGARLANMLGAKTAEKGLEDVTSARLFKRGLGDQA